MFMSTPIVTALAAFAPLAAADFHIGHTRNIVCGPQPVPCVTPGGIQIVPSNDWDSAYRLPNLVGSIDTYGAGVDSHINACGYTDVTITDTQGDQDQKDAFMGNLRGDAGQIIGECYWSDNQSSSKDGMSFVDKIICYSDMCGR